MTICPSCEYGGEYVAKIGPHHCYNCKFEWCDVNQYAYTEEGELSEYVMIGGQVVWPNKKDSLSVFNTEEV
jgi:hypothetical protein